MFMFTILVDNMKIKNISILFFCTFLLSQNTILSTSNIEEKADSLGIIFLVDGNSVECIDIETRAGFSVTTSQFFPNFRVNIHCVEEDDAIDDLYETNVVDRMIMPDGTEVSSKDMKKKIRKINLLAYSIISAVIGLLVMVAS